MVRQSDSDKDEQQNWQSRSVKQRAELSLSIEEALADTTLKEDSFSDEVEESLHVSKSSVIIPPRLSLQSRPMAVVFAGPKEVTVGTPCITTTPVEVQHATQKELRLAGRTTKVHLQAVPKLERKLDSKISLETEKNTIAADDEVQINEKSKPKRNSSSKSGALAKSMVESKAQRSLAGSGVLKQGQREVMVTNAHISPSSVVVVTLLENPGPVVVKYITLLPQTGFTLHFSDSVEAEARFNYVVLMGEIF
jgi:hypothetical protein